MYHGTFMPFSSSQMSRCAAVLPIVINTRPVERAEPLTRHLQAAGFRVVDMPMLAIQPRLIVDADIEMMRRWLAGDYQALVVVSPTAAASGLAVWQTLEQEPQLSYQPLPNDDIRATQRLTVPSPIIAVGDATAAVLQAEARMDGYLVRQPIIANNEGMLAMPEIESLQAHDKLLIWRGLGGRRLLVDTLQARGVQSDSIAWYERTMPPSAVTDYQHWLSSCSRAHSALSELPEPIVIISSATAFEHWTSTLAQAKMSYAADDEPDTLLALADFVYVVLGVRLAQRVARQQLHYVQVEDLAPETILAAIQSRAEIL